MGGEEDRHREREKEGFGNNDVPSGLVLPITPSSCSLSLFLSVPAQSQSRQACCIRRGDPASGPNTGSTSLLIDDSL